MDGGGSSRGKKRKIDELKLDDESIKRLVAISNEQKFQMRRLQRELKKVETTNQQLIDYIQSKCNHEMVRDFSNIEPCGPTHYECKKCGYWY